MRFFFVLLVSSLSFGQAWVAQQSGTTASLRGISAVSREVAWASGANGTFVVTTDGGETWKASTVPGAADLDFRGIHAFDPKTVILMSAGSGEKSRLYKTTDGGATWKLLYTNPDPAGFFDAIAFWDAKHGILLGDPVHGHFVILTTDDGGQTWEDRKAPRIWERSAMPLALLGEGAFAASNSSLVVLGANEAWFGTGGRGGARVFHTLDGGKTWTIGATTIKSENENAGIFSMGFSDPLHGIAVGGDHTQPQSKTNTISVTSDGGKKWSSPFSTPNGYRSGVLYLPDQKLWIAVGTNGSDVSPDGGLTWRPFDKQPLNAMSFVLSYAGWAVGPDGAIFRFSME